MSERQPHGHLVQVDPREWVSWRLRAEQRLPEAGREVGQQVTMRWWWWWWLMPEFSCTPRDLAMMHCVFHRCQQGGVGGIFTTEQ